MHLFCGMEASTVKLLASEVLFCCKFEINDFNCAFSVFMMYCYWDYPLQGKVGEVGDRCSLRWVGDVNFVRSYAFINYCKF